MSSLRVLNREEVNESTKGVFDALQKKVGMVPNLYAATANSPKALNALLTLGENLGGGEFSAKEVEAIALAIGEANNCDYCLAAHTAVGKMNGFSEEETLRLRSADTSDEKLKALTQLAREITITRGKPDAEYISNFNRVGYTPAALAELVGYVAQNTFTNYLNHIAETPIDFPLAKDLKASSLA
ncbi:MAG: carboxymuconolactone decarboxylase family protein [Cyclobacteriaceae bacterium]